MNFPEDTTNFKVKAASATKVHLNIKYLKVEFKVFMKVSLCIQDFSQYGGLESVFLFVCFVRLCFCLTHSLTSKGGN